MKVHKELTKNNELYVYINGKLIYKKWLDTGHSKVFDVMAYDKYTYASYTDLDFEHSKHLIHVKAKIRFLTAEEGGRETGITSGYRPNHVFEYKPNGEMVEAMMGDIQFTNPKTLELGKVYELLIRFIAIQRLERFMNVDQNWWIHEGNRKVGEAQILKFLQPMEI